MSKGCSPCDNQTGHEKEACETCVKNVEDTPFEKKGVKEELMKKCGEGREGQKEVQDRVHERLADNHNETKPDAAAMISLRKSALKQFSAQVEDHDMKWYMP